MSRWRDRIRISGGFWLLAAWFTLVNGWQLLAVILSAAERIACWAGGTTALALGGLVLWLIGRTGGSLWLLPAAFGLLAAALRELHGRKADFL